MEFFNKKEEVIDIKLTQYGKYLLSQGKFKPVFYSFSDEEILYDSDYGVGTENQNATELRIQENTPSLKIQHNYVSLEKEARKSPDEQASKERNQLFVSPIANSNLGVDKFPAWKIEALSGEFSTDSTTPIVISSITSEILEIPQIGATITYTVTPELLEEIRDEGFITEVETGKADGVPSSLLESIAQQGMGIEVGNLTFETMIFPDGSSYTIERDNLILQIVEDNAPFGNENFEIEVFEVEDANLIGQDGVELATENLTPLLFPRPVTTIVNDILLDEMEQPEQEVTDQFVEYYFDMEVDDEIDASLVCGVLAHADEDEYKFARKDFSCSDTQANYQYLSPYSQKESDTDTECED